jgi:hypothetical protein
MSAQSDARAEITGILNAITFNGQPLVVRDNPTNVNPWCVVIASADPVLTNENTSGSVGDYEYNLLLQFVGGSPETSSLAVLEDMVESAILALGNSEYWYPGNASAPFVGDGGDGKVYLTITLPATKYIEIGGA